MLPILLGASLGGSARARPVWIVLGFVGAFSASALAFGASARVLGVSHAALRAAAIAALLGFGALSLLPRTFDALAPRLAGVAALGARLAAFDRGGRLGALALGAALGALWTPCAGPVLAAILVLIATQEPGRAAPLLAAYALGRGLPMLAIAHGGRAVAARVPRLARGAGVLRRAFGVLVIVSALALLRG